MKMKKKFFTIALAMGLVLSLVPGLTTAMAAAIIPTVSTTSATATGTGSVEAVGTVTNSGTGGPVIDRGFVYGTAIYPTIGQANVTKVAAGSGTGSFTATLTGMAANTVYYVRAYAINASGTSYGHEDVTVTVTIVPAITGIEASPGTLAAAGGTSRITVLGTALPENIAVAAVSGGTQIRGTTSGMNNQQQLVLPFPANTGGTAKIYTIYASLDGVTPSVYTATVTVAAGTMQTPDSDTGGTPASNAGSAPNVMTNAASGATLTGTVVGDNGWAVTERGFVFGKAAAPFIGGADVTKITAGSGSGVFEANVPALTPGVTYYARAYAINSEGINYGADIQFTAVADELDDVPKTGDEGRFLPVVGIAGLFLLTGGLFSLSRRCKKNKA